MRVAENTGLTIRKVKMWEVPQLLHFRAVNDYNAPADERSVNPESFVYTLLKMLWHGDRMATFVALHDRDIAGYVTLVFGRHRKFKGNVHLVSIAVSSNHRGSGIGTKLFSVAEDHARSRGARRIELEVFASNTGAIKLYERLAYVVEGVKRRAVENKDGFDDLILMAKFL